MPASNLPALPPGFELDQPGATIPPPPPGFTVDSPATTAERPPRTRTEAVMRQLGLGGRGLYQAATDLAYLPLDLATGAYNATLGPADTWLSNKLRGTQREFTPLPYPSQQRDEALTQLGLPQPENASEKVANFIVRGGAGAGGLAKVASMAGTGPVARALANRPTLQMVSGATGGASTGIAREQGYGPVAQFAAGIAGGMAPALVAPRVPVQSMAPMAYGRASGSAAAQASASSGSAAAETTVTGGAQATGRGGGYTYGSVGPDPSAGLNAPMRRVMARGRELGFRPTPGQATGSRALQQIEAKLESQPMTSGAFNDIKAGNQSALNRAVARAIGVNAEVVDESTLATALQRMEGTFQRAADDTVRNIDPRGFTNWLGILQHDMRGLVRGVASEPLIEDLTRLAVQGGATGKQLQSLTSKLGKAAYKQMTTPNGDRDLGIALYRTKDYVDDLLMQGMDEQRLADFQTARQHYRNLMMLTSRVGVVNPSSGNVSGRSLANVLQTRDRRGFMFGENRSDMYDAARFAQAFGPIVGDSGTATRSALPGATDFVLSLPFNLASRAYTSSPSVNLAVRANALASAGAGYRNSLRGAPDIRGVGPYYNALIERQPLERRGAP